VAPWGLSERFVFECRESCFNGCIIEVSIILLWYSLKDDVSLVWKAQVSSVLVRSNFLPFELFPFDQTFRRPELSSTAVHFKLKSLLCFKFLSLALIFYSSHWKKNILVQSSSEGKSIFVICKSNFDFVRHILVDLRRWESQLTVTETVLHKLCQVFNKNVYFFQNVAF